MRHQVQASVTKTPTTNPKMDQAIIWGCDKIQKSF